jgi:HlyD family secretion protein
MDIPRKSQARRRKMLRIVYAVVGLIAVALVTVALSRLKPAAPSVDRAMVWVDKVKRGPMLRQVRGAGTLVPEMIRWIPAATEAQVERIVILPGSQVRSDTVILELSNPDLELAALEATSQLKAAEAELASLRVRLESEQLTQRAAAALVQSEHRQAELQAAADEELAKEGLVAELTLKLSQVREQELANRAEIEAERLEIGAESVEAQLAAQRARVDQLRAAADHQWKLVDQLRVRAGVDGVLQQVPVEVGQRVTPGANLARVAEPGRLKAEVRIAETQARDVQIGQVASIDTRNGVIPGRVSRIDPAVQNGTVTVDVALEGELPRGARPDLSVDGTIELERLDDVLYVGRPAFGQEHSTVGLFRLMDSGAEGVRTQVQLGRSSVSTVEIVEGLQEGDEVILSDMSAWDEFDRVRLKG